MYHQTFLEIQPLKLEEMSCGEQKNRLKKEKEQIDFEFKAFFLPCKGKRLTQVIEDLGDF